MLNTLQGRMEARMEKDDDHERAKIVELRQTAFEHLEAGRISRLIDRIGW